MATDFESRMRDLVGDLADGLDEVLAPLNKESDRLWDEYEDSDLDSDVVSHLAAVYEDAANRIEAMVNSLVREFRKRN